MSSPTELEPHRTSRGVAALRGARRGRSRSTASGRAPPPTCAMGEPRRARRHHAASSGGQRCRWPATARSRARLARRAVERRRPVGRPARSGAHRRSGSRRSRRARAPRATRAPREGRPRGVTLRGNVWPRADPGPPRDARRPTVATARATRRPSFWTWLRTNARASRRRERAPPATRTGFPPSGGPAPPGPATTRPLRGPLCGWPSRTSRRSERPQSRTASPQP